MEGGGEATWHREGGSAEGATSRLVALEVHGEAAGKKSRGKGGEGGREGGIEEGGQVGVPVHCSDCTALHVRMMMM